MNEMRLHDRAGHRLYLNSEERAAFLSVARRQGARTARSAERCTSPEAVLPSTTAIYADAVGREEQEIAARTWG